VRPALVPSTQPDPPYPHDTRVRGWRFQLDHERLDQSDTWALAGPEWRPWLLMVWLTAWRQCPAGSLPADHALIAAKIGLDERMLTAHADILLRGFRRYADGRLYHDTIVEQVTQYLEHNRKEAARVAEWREKKRQKADTVTEVLRVTNTDVPMSTTPEPEPDNYSSSLRSDESAVVAKKPRRAAPPTADILRLWSEILPDLPQPIDPAYWTPTRKAQIAARWADQLPDLDAWRDLFERIAESRFLTGKTTRPFKADLFWATKPENLLRIHEGRYA
jgi:hypothetical protein